MAATETGSSTRGFGLGRHHAFAALASSILGLIWMAIGSGGSIPNPVAPLSLSVFPGAEGFGIDTPAGRGGRIIKVTNLNDSGAGSLRVALESPGPRTVVFEVSGTITLNSPIYIDKPFLTVAGQTAPSPGITLRGGSLVIRTHDLLLQHLRIRPGDQGRDPPGRDAITLMAYPRRGVVHDVVIDHCSLSWGVDENLDINFDADGVTISHCLISEGLHRSKNRKGPHSKAVLISNHCDRVALVKNLVAHHDDRHPNISGGGDSVVSVNNLWYNAGSRWVSLSDPYGNGPILFADVENLYIDGPNTHSPQVYYLHRSLPEGTRIYLHNNRHEGSGAYLKDVTRGGYLVDSPPLWTESIRVLPAAEVEAYLLGRAGARPGDRDAVDRRIVEEVRNRTGAIIDTQLQVGGWPELAENRVLLDLPTDPNGDHDGDGYTNLEEVLHRLAAKVEGRP